MKFLRGLLVITLGLALILSYLPKPVSATTVAPTTVRIGLFFDNSSHSAPTVINLSSPCGIQLGWRSGTSFTVKESIAANQTVKIDIDSTTGQLRLTTAQGTVVTNLGTTLVAEPVDATEWINLAEKGTGYRGLLELSVVNKHVRVVNELSVEDYLYGVVPKEMSNSWPVEALKAQAVAARTYVAANMNQYGSYGFDLTDDQYSQAYGGVKAEGANARSAVDQTKGQILLYNGQPIAAVYHSNSGGYTENSENVWSTALPYLRGVPDPYDLGQGSSMDHWQVTFTKDDLQNWINTTLHNNGHNPIGTLLDIKVLKTGVSGRLTDVEIDGSQGSTEVKNDLIRYYLGNLNSNLFKIISNINLFGLGQSGQAQAVDPSQAYVVRGDGTVSQLSGTSPVLQGDGTTVTANTSPSSYTFNGQGWGHGVGMSQWGAYGMAKAGKSYAQILAYYYQGTQLTK